jgi:L-fuconolactonase
LCRGDVRRGLQVVAESNLAYDLIVQAEQWPATVATVRALPQLRFVVDHLGNPSAGRPSTSRGSRPSAPSRPHRTSHSSCLDWSHGPTRRRQRPLISIEPYVRALSDLVGPERILFGSDWPVCTPVSDYAGVVGTAPGLIERFGPEAQEQIFRRSATTVYRLDLQ